MPLRSVLVTISLLGTICGAQAQAQAQTQAAEPPTYRIEGYAHRANHLLPCGTPVEITAQLRADPLASLRSFAIAGAGERQIYLDFAAAHVFAAGAGTAATSRDGQSDYIDFFWGPLYHSAVVEDRTARPSVPPGLSGEPSFPPLVTGPLRRPIRPLTPVPQRETGPAAAPYPTECEDDLPPVPMPAADIVRIVLALRAPAGDTSGQPYRLGDTGRSVHAFQLTFRDESRAALGGTSLTKAWAALGDFPVAEATGQVFGEYYVETPTGSGHLLARAPFRIVSVKKVPPGDLPLPLPPRGE